MADMNQHLPESICFIERDWLSSNQVMLYDEHGATLIDTGYSKHVELTLAIVDKRLEQAPTGCDAKLVRIINTHLHSDHCGANAALKRQHDCDIIVPEKCFDTVQRWNEDELTYRGTGQICERFSASGQLCAGDTFVAGQIEWHAYAAPGHDPTSLIFHAPKIATLFTADALWQHGYGLIFPEILGLSGFKEQAEVLDLIESLAPKVIIPGHGAIFTDLNAALSEARSRLAAQVAKPSSLFRLAIKVLVKFALLEYEQVSITQLHRLAANADIMCAAANRLGLPIEQAVDQALASLLKQGQLTVTGETVENA